MDRTIKIWDIEKKTQVLSFEGHKGDILDVAFTPNKKYVLSASTDSKICIWDIEAQKLKSTLNGHTGYV